MQSSKRAARPRGTPYPQRAANGWWYVHWSEGRRSKRASLGTQDEREARTRFAHWLLLDGKDRDGQGEPVGRTVEEFWTVYDERHVQTATVVPAGRQTIGYAWANLRPHFGHLLPSAVDQSVVDRYVALRSSGGLGRAARSITIRRELATLVACFNFCARPNVRVMDKAEIPAIQLPPAGPPRDRWLRMDEMQRLLDAAAEGRRGDRLSRVERFLWLALFTAARKQAILDLTWDRVDFETSVIHLAVPGRQETKKRRASVTIATQLRPVLERAYRERTSAYVLDHPSDDVWASIQYVAIRAGFSDQKVKRGESPKGTGVSPHVLRHTAATHMARRGVPLWQIAKILGNTMAMVEKVYAKWVPENPEGTVDLISNGVLEPAE